MEKKKSNFLRPVWLVDDSKRIQRIHTDLEMTNKTRTEKDDVGCWGGGFEGFEEAGHDWEVV